MGPKRPLTSIFFGGGTPSELSTPQLARITDALRESFGFEDGTRREWTITLLKYQRLM